MSYQKFYKHFYRNNIVYRKRRKGLHDRLYSFNHEKEEAYKGSSTAYSHFNFFTCFIIDKRKEEGNYPGGALRNTNLKCLS